MARPDRSRTVLADIIADGLGSRAAWLGSEFENFDEALTWLSRTYPRAGLATLKAAWNWAMEARIAGGTWLQANILPPRSQVPVDPTIPANRNFRYELEVTFGEPDPQRQGTVRDRTHTVYWIYTTNALQTAQDLARTAPPSIIARLQRLENRRRDRSPLPEGFERFDIEIIVRSVSRRS